jgi:hypothetical protein
MTFGRCLLGSAAVVALAGSHPALVATALPYSKHIQLVTPKDGATIAYTSEDEALTFSFHVDTLALRAELARETGFTDNCIGTVDLYVKCDGPTCKNGPPAMLVRNGQDQVSLRVGALLALTTDPSSPRATFIWGAEFHDIENKNASPPCLSITLAATAARLTLERNAGPPRLALSLDPDAPGAWPRSITVTDAGGASKATFLAVSWKTLNASDAAIARNCAAVDGSKTHTVEAMEGRGTKRTFEIPPLPPSAAQRELLLKALAPAGTPTPPPAKTPPKLAAAPAASFHDSSVHQVVTCQYRLDAHLGTDTNANDPNKSNNALSRTIAIDVKLN